MRGSRLKLISELSSFTLKNIKRIEAKFDPFNPNASSVREFFQEVTSRRRLKQSPEIVTRSRVVCDNSDPLVTIQFVNNHKLVLNAKHLDTSHIVKLIKQYELVHRNDPDEL